MLFLHQAGRYYQAVIQYQRIISWLEIEYGTGDMQQKKIQDYILTSHLNLALCFLRLKEFTQAVDNCNKVSWCLPISCTCSWWMFNYYYTVHLFCVC